MDKKRIILWAVLGALIGALLVWFYWANSVEANTVTPEPKLTFLCKAPEEGKANAYISGSEGFTPVEVNKGDYLFRVLNGGKGDITSYEVKLASNLIYTGGAVLAGGHDFFTVDTAMAGLTIYAQPSGQHGTSSTNETLCEMLPEPSPEPSPTPTPSEEPKQELVHASTTEAPNTCTASVPESAQNIHGYRKGGTFEVKWYPVEADGVNIYYYQNQNPDNAHSVINTDNDGSEFIHGLGSLDWTFGVQSLNEGCAGSEIRWVEDGVTNEWILFRS